MPKIPWTTLQKTTIVFFLAATASFAEAQFVYFGRDTDTIDFGSLNTVGTTAYTMEAVIRPTRAGTAHLFTEQKDGGEDKQMSIGQDGTGIGGWTPQKNWATLWNGPISGDQFHHVAWVRSGAMELTYLDGILVHSYQLTGADNVPISNVTGSRMSVGGFRYTTAGFADSFQGWVDSIRISNIDRYTGSTAEVTLGDQRMDANTLLLLNFDAADPFRDAVSGVWGTPGSGYPGATSPSAVPEPAVLVGTSAALWICRPRRKKSP